MLSEQRKDFLNKAIAAIYSRKFYAAYPEHPAPAIYGETADADGKAAFEAALNKPFTGLAQSSTQHGGDEVSPYTGESLGIHYPLFTPTELVEKASAVKRSWGKATADERANVLLHSLELFKDNFFQIAYATMHTTGQAYMMSFQASGPHAADRALEAVAMGYEELNRFPSTTEWEKPMGKYSITLNKSWRAVPK
ncbi:MAG: phenylacetic acid degradation protein PaaN, partial [Flexibacteraceae bacterium]